MKIYQITISGKIEIDEPIDKNKEYSLALKRIQNDQGKTTTHETEDTETVCWKMVNLDIATLISGESVISGKSKKGSPSQVLRLTLFELYEQQYAGSDEYKDRDDFYNKTMQKIIEKFKDKLL